MNGTCTSDGCTLPADHGNRTIIHPTELGAAEAIGRLYRWLRHDRFCVVAVSATPESERCTCGLAAAWNALADPPVHVVFEDDQPDRFRAEQDV